MNSRRLYYDDSFLTDFRARLTDIGPDGTQVRLDRSAFYPTSGGQISDRGTIGGIPVADVLEDDEGEMVHLLTSPLAPDQNGTEVDCRIDPGRRFDHMQQHSGQHLLSAVLEELASIPTLSFHMSADVSTIDLETAAIDTATLERAEERCNAIIAENHPVTVSYEDAAAVHGLRKASGRQGELRIVTIGNLDRSACGGTHVRATGEIGCLLLRGTERVRGNTRLEFVCGMRAVRRARLDYNALSGIGRAVNAGIDDAAGIVASLVPRFAEAEKQRVRLAIEIAAVRGRESWRAVEPAAGGLRINVFEVPAIGDEARGEAQAFTSCGQAVAIAWCRNPASVLLSCSGDSGVHAGNVLKSLLAARGGRGGGNAQMAQGGVPSGVQELVTDLEGEIRITALR